MELYKKHRPNGLNKLIGNESVIQTINSALESGSVPHCILLSGPSGSGKTTTARILKKSLGCSDQDFIEVNCADNNGVDFGREIAQKMNFKPMGGKVRIWLLDECHKLTAACANVLLKPFEDCPAHVYFILCTTEPDGLLGTIKTRATHYAFQSLTESNLKRLLQRVARIESIELSEEGIQQIIINSMGSARMALVMLDQIKGLPAEEMKDVIAKIAERESQGVELARALLYKKSWSEIAGILRNLKEDPEKVRRGILGYCRAIGIGENTKEYMRDLAGVVCDAFKENFFNTGASGLFLASLNVHFDTKK